MIDPLWPYPPEPGTRTLYLGDGTTRQATDKEMADLEQGVWNPIEKQEIDRDLEEQKNVIAVFRFIATTAFLSFAILCLLWALL